MLIVLSLCLAYDNFVSNLKSSLGMEKQKNSLLSEEVKIKKGTVERLRSELENTKEQLDYMKEEKGKNYILCPVLLGYWVKEGLRMCVHTWSLSSSAGAQHKKAVFRH